MDATLEADKEHSVRSQHVVIIGNGHLGQALAEYFSRTVAKTPRYTVAHTHRRSVDPTIANAASQADIVLLVVPSAAYKKLISDIAPLLRPNTIVIDVANAPLRFFSCFSSSDRLPSTAILSKMLPPTVPVVKAFTTISATFLTELNQELVPLPTNTMLPFALNYDEDCLRRMNQLISDLNFTPHYMGNLHPFAKHLEAIPHIFFPSFKSTLIVSAIVWVWWTFYFLLSVIILSRGPTHRQWDKFPLSSFLATTGEASISMFSITFLAGPIAIIWKSFKPDLPNWLKNWLNRRKQLGLVAFVFATLHAFAGGMSASNLKISWRGQYYSVPGVISYVMFGLLVVCSTIYVKNLSWAEFRAVFSYLGTAALALGVLHQALWGIVLSRSESEADLGKYWVDTGSTFPIHWLGIILPLMVLTLRVITWMPCFWQNEEPENSDLEISLVDTSNEAEG